MTVQIRSSTDKDLKSIVTLLNDAYKEAYEFIPYTEEKLRSWIQEGNPIILVAEENGEITGCVAYRSGHWGEEIEWLAVHKSQKRKLIENTLVTEAEKCVKGETVFLSD
jgi:N-acetylglutamate synthase-like GNAT family acetyltransferase